MSSESSVNLEPKVTPPSPKSTEEDSMEPEDTLSSERGRLEISSNTKSQDETAKGYPQLTNILNYVCKTFLILLFSIYRLQDMENMPGEDLLSENLESAHKKVTRYNSALDMTLKVKQTPAKIRFKNLSSLLLIQLIRYFHIKSPSLLISVDKL